MVPWNFAPSAGISSVRVEPSRLAVGTGSPVAPWSGLSRVAVKPSLVVVRWKTMRSFVPPTSSVPCQTPSISDGVTAGAGAAGADGFTARVKVRGIDWPWLQVPLTELELASTVPS